MTAPWQRQPLTREQAAQAQEWLQRDPWAYWACMAAWARVTYGHDLPWFLADFLHQHRGQGRPDVPADEMLTAWVQSQPPDSVAYWADLWPLAQRLAGGGIIDRGKAVKASELPGWKDDRHLVQGRMFTNQMTLLHGAPAAAKGFVLLDLAFRCALGLDWFGAKVRKTRSLIIYPEASRRLSRRRDAWCLANGRSAAELGDVVFYPLAVPLNDQTTGEIIDWCADDGFGQVIADNLFSMTPGQDLRGPEASGEVMTRLVRIKDETGGHVLAVHHDTKMGGYYGGVQFDAFADTRIAAAGAGDGLRTLAAGTGGNGKQRDLAPFSITFGLGVVQLGQDADGNPVSSCAVREPSWQELQAMGAARIELEDKVRAEAQACPGDSARSIAKRLAGPGASQRTIERIVAEYRRAP